MDSTEDLHLTMMERQPWTLWTDRKLLRRFQDELPQHTPPVLHGQHSGVASPSASETSPVSSSSSMIQWVFTSAKSIFGLFHWYQSATPPMYEPDDHLTIKDLSSITLLHEPSQETLLNYYPYPNWSSFLLGDWFGIVESPNPRAALIPLWILLVMQISIKMMFVTSTGTISTIHSVPTMPMNGLMMMLAGPPHLYQFHSSHVEVCHPPQMHVLEIMWSGSFVIAS